MGKTTVALALGLAAARRGLRTIVCEVAHQERFSRLMGREGVGYEETEIADHLNAISLDQQHTLEEWVTYQLPSKTLAGLLYRNGIFQHLTSAAPGIKELVTIGKIWELAQLHRKSKDARPYDFVVVDSPATGHGLGHAARAAHVRRHRARRPDPPPGRPDPRLHRLRQDRRAGGGAAGGDAGERDARVLARRSSEFRGALDAVV